MIKFFKLDIYEYLLWDIYNIQYFYVKHQEWIFLYSQVGIVYSVPNLSTFISKYISKSSLYQLMQFCYLNGWLWYDLPI